MKRLLFLWFFVCSFYTYAQEEPEFDYKSITVIAAIKDDKNCFFAGHGVFLDMRKIIEKAANQFKPTHELPAIFMYELLMMDTRGRTKTIFLGDHWLSDLNQISPLTDVDYSWLLRIIKARNFENDNSILKGFNLKINVEDYNDILSRALDYEQAGQMPAEPNKASAEENSMSNARVQKADETKGKTEHIKKPLPAQSPSAPQITPMSSDTTKLSTENATEIFNSKRVTIIDETKEKEIAHEKTLFSDLTPKISYLLWTLAILLISYQVWRKIKNQS